MHFMCINCDTGELYYVCVEDVPTLTICPDDQLFDLVYSGCNFPGMTCIEYYF